LGFNITSIFDIFFKVDNVPDGWVKVFYSDQDVIIIKKELLDKINCNYVVKSVEWEWVKCDKLFCLNQDALAEALSNKLKNNSLDSATPITIAKCVKK